MYMGRSDAQLFAILPCPGDFGGDIVCLVLLSLCLSVLFVRLRVLALHERGSTLWMWSRIAVLIHSWPCYV